MRLIDVDELEVVSFTTPSNIDKESYLAGVEFILNEIDELPTINVEPTIHAKWISSCYKESYGCTNCHQWQDKKTDYCPECGAKMDVPDINVGDKEGIK